MEKASKLPCRLVYVTDEKKVEILPTLELIRQNELWGLEISGSDNKPFFISLRNDGFDNWMSARKKIKQNIPGWTFKFASIDQLSEIYIKRQKIADTLRILRKFGIEADDFLPGWYWSSGEFGMTKVHTFDMREGAFEVHDRFDNNGFVRWSLERLK